MKSNFILQTWDNNKEEMRFLFSLNYSGIQKMRNSYFLESWQFPLVFWGTEYDSTSHAFPIKMVHLHLFFFEDTYKCIWDLILI